MIRPAKQNALYAVAGVSAVCMIAGLCFGILCPSNGMLYMSSAPGMDGNVLMYNGYSMIGLLSDFSSGNAIEKVLMIFCLVQLIVGIASCIILPVSYFFFRRGETVTTLTVTVTALAFGVAYTVLGMIYLTDSNDVLWRMLMLVTGMIKSSLLGLYGSLDFTTVCLIPAAITGMLVLTYCLLNVFFRRGESAAARQSSAGSDTAAGPSSGVSDPLPAAAPPSDGGVSVAGEDDLIRLLRQYKELLDGGIITQEEFEDKKKKLLK